MSTQSPTPVADVRGFTLIELLVALVILVMSMTVIYAVFSNGLTSLMLSKEYSRAALLAESHLAGVGVVDALEEMETRGRFDDKYEWRIRVQKLEDEPSGLDLEQRAEIHRVELTVSWLRAGRLRHLSFSTLRLSDADNEGGLTRR